MDYIVSVEDIESGLENSVEFDDEIKELENCHIKTTLSLKPLGEYIEIKGHISGKITLECDRCLNKFNYDLDFNIDELYAKNSLYEEYGQEVELASGQFVTDLNGEDKIDIYDLLYQSVILALPNKKVCGINCNEGYFVTEEEYKPHDSRMDVFKNIKINPKI